MDFLSDFFRRLSQRLDFIVLVSAIVLISFGLLAVYSASNGVGTITIFKRQMMWVGFGTLAIFIMYFLPYRLFQDWAYLVYGLSLVGLLVVLILGRKIAGSVSWVSIGIGNFQPSELTKFTTIAALAKFLSHRDTDITRPKDFIIAMVIVFLPVSLIMLQPDTGTALTYLTFIVPLIVLAGFDFYYIMILAVPAILTLVGFVNFWGAIVIAIAILLVLLSLRRNIVLSTLSPLLGLGASFAANYMANRVLKPHQLKRIQTFLDPLSDPQGAGYNALQAKVAIGSGGFFGKGFLEGTQTQLKFIPAQWTDFIFCVIGEELGFLGASVLLLTYMLLLMRVVRITQLIKNRFSIMVLAGIVSLFLGHIIVNVGMTIGLVPVIGIPLPFLSYGGSSLFANMIAIGLILNIYKNRRDLSFSA
ncbi:MAG: rod shape-determining protein RodA [Chloroherpetonaceae bacterium]|nr:rod shape-determining protein RodA [Chloroherpetonaceae bacterium]